jgi:hypothetical protein
MSQWVTPGRIARRCWVIPDRSQPVSRGLLHGLCIALWSNDTFLVRVAACSPANAWLLSHPVAERFGDPVECRFQARMAERDVQPGMGRDAGGCAFVECDVG